jgi:hypothetical protein
MNASLTLECLESREVPAIVLDGNFTGSTADGTFEAFANGGAVVINEIGGTFVAFNAQGLNGVSVTKPETNADSIVLENAGSLVVLTNPDEIFIRLENGNFVNVGTSLIIRDVTQLTVDLLLGGNDRIVDRTNLDAVLTGGPGNDTIRATGGAVHQFVILQVTKPGGADPANFSLLSTLAPLKNLKGKDGKDTLTGPLFGFGTILAGGNGADRLTGGFGKDLLVGGNGTDNMSGGGGRDTYNAIDNLRDFIFNRPGDIVGGDSFDVKSI